MIRENAVQTVHLTKPLRSVQIVSASLSKPYTQQASQSASAGGNAGAAKEQIEERDYEAERIAQQQRLVDALQAIAESLAEVETNRSQSLGELQVLAVEIAMLATTQVLGHVVEQDQFPLAELIEDAIGRLDADRTITVSVHPQDLKQLQQLKTEYSEAAAESGQAVPNPTEWMDQVKLKADAQLQRGSCLADGGDFGLLSTLDSRLAELRQCFMEGLDHAQVERRATESEDQTMRRFPNRRETA